MTTKIWLALSSLILSSLLVSPVMGMAPEKEQGEPQISKAEVRKEQRKELTAFRNFKRDALTSSRQEHRKGVTAFKISKREAAE